LGMAQAHGWRQRSFTFALWRQLRRWIQPPHAQSHPLFWTPRHPRRGSEHRVFCLLCRDPLDAVDRQPLGESEGPSGSDYCVVPQSRHPLTRCLRAH
jgi:hypothetical protein